MLKAIHNIPPRLVISNRLSADGDQRAMLCYSSHSSPLDSSHTGDDALAHTNLYLVDSTAQGND